MRIALIAAALLGIAALGPSLMLATRGTPEEDVYPLGISPADATSLRPEKAAIWEQERRLYVDSITTPLPRKIATPPPASTRPRPIGVLNRSGVRGGMSIVNAWAGYQGGKYVVVSAGHVDGDPTRGLVMLQREGSNDSVVADLAGGGAVRIVRADTNGIRLVSSAGRQYRFDLVSEAFASLAGGCCALQLDPDVSTPAIQALANVSVGSNANIAIVIGENLGDLGAFNFKLIYDDTRLAPVAGAGGGLEGNPDFNQQALGAQWSCSLPSNSGSPDIDPATGPGHGVAFLSCFTNINAPVVTNGAVVATLRLRVLATGESTIAIAEANFNHSDGVEIGSCAPVTTTEMTCMGAIINGQ